MTSSFGATEPWINELREQLIEAGYDERHIEAHMRAACSRLRSRRAHAAFPLLVERWVQRALRR